MTPSVQKPATHNSQPTTHNPQPTTPMTHPAKYYIIGGGKSGQKAAAYLRKSTPDAVITVVDVHKPALEQAKALGCEAAPMDGISFLILQEWRIKPEDWVVPCIPVHVAYEWVRQKMRQTASLRQVPVPEAAVSLMPNPIRADGGQVFASHATFTCPEDCPEPEDFCTVTGEPRPGMLHEILDGIDITGFRSVSLISTQLGPGFGGFQLAVLQKALADVTAEAGGILLSTACKCHGVIHAFEWEPK